MRFLAMSCLFFLGVNTTLANSLNGGALAFDIRKANQQFDHINLKLSVQNLSINDLNAAVNTLTKLTANADECTEDIQKKINNIEALIKQGNSAADSKNEGADLVYLNSQQKEFADEQAQCRLFTIRAKEAIEAYKTAMVQIKQEETLTRGIPLWKIIRQTIDAPPETELLSVLTTQIPAALPSLLYWALFILIASMISTVILRQARKSQFARHYLRFKKLPISYIALLTSFLTAGTLFVYLLISSPDISTPALPLILSGLVFFYLSSSVFIIFLFKLNTVRAFFCWYSLDHIFLQSFCITLLSFYTAAMIEQLFSYSFNTNSPLWQLFQSFFTLIILTTSIYFTYYFCKIHRHIPFIKDHHHIILRFSTSLLITCAILNILGYRTLTQHLIFSGFTTIAIIFITLLITQGINKFYLTLSHQQAMKTKIIKYFGYRKDQVFTEFLILKTIAQLIVVAISVYWIGQSWGFATDFIGSIYEQFLNGVRLVNITFYPTRVISGVVVFCLLYLLFRAISTAISNHQQFEDEEETQVAVASILTYIGFGLAMISGLLVAGFDFTGLAIIAGALSVGIGLGLQSIVNNFVSGLILLIEKPIRPGDRINVDGVEGFVKKIRVRSTQILSPSREDIIVPNSDLITRRVTNYMFSDKYCQINCELGVAYGSDTLLVRDVLLNVANQHEEVIKTGRHKPTVLFRSFAASALIFQLGCLIKDVNKKSIVQSDLNFAIERAFREHNIHMPFPQSEVHLTMTDLAELAKSVNVNVAPRAD